MDNKVLGKGLSALISQGQTKTNTNATQEAMDKVRAAEAELQAPFKGMRFSPVATELISYNPFQPRQNYDEDTLEELKASIKEKGILQPILVRPRKEGGFEVVAGERRLRAAKALGLPNVPVVIKEISDNKIQHC